MKKDLYLFAFALLCIFYSCKPHYTSKKYLQQVVDKINTIQSASYYTTEKVWAPGAKKPEK